MSDPVPASAAGKLICFEIRGQRMGCPIRDVKETIVLRPITRVFLVPAWVAGIINLRGDIVAVLDLGAFLGLGSIVPGPEARIVIVRVGAEVAGLLVDRLAEVRSVDVQDLAPPPPTVAADLAAVLSDVATLPGGAPLAVLAPKKLFDSERLRAFARRA
jgi:purine-binding chemotaxis protein CheW